MKRRKARTKRPPRRLEEVDLSDSDALEDHIAKHGVRLREVIQVFRDLPRPFRKGNRILVVGFTGGGRVLTIPMTPSRSRGLWRPLTAYDAGKEERAKYGQG